MPEHSVQPKPPGPSRWFRPVLFLITLLLLWGTISRCNGGVEKPKEISIDELYADIDGGLVKEVNVDPSDGSVEGVFADGKKFKTKVADEDGLEARAVVKGVKITANPTSKTWMDILVSFLLGWGLLVVFIIVFFWLMSRGQRNSVKQGFGEFGSIDIKPEHRAERYSDIAGCDETKEEVKEICEDIKDPEPHKRFGVGSPHGILLVGHPGTGKTLMAKAAAGETGIPFFALAGSQFDEMLVGAGSSRVRDLFAKAKKAAPCIIFIDEFDTIGRRRGIGGPATPAWADQTLSQLLTEMDGFGTNDRVKVMAATNQPQLLDPAVLRRFPRKAVFDLPDLDTREKILQIHGRGKPLHPTVDLRKIAKGTPTYSGSDLKDVMNESGLLAMRRYKEAKKKDPNVDLNTFFIMQADLEEAIEKVLWGESKKKSALSMEDRKIVANHEAGHAWMTLMTHADPLRKVTILARGMSGGSTWHEVDERKLGRNKEYFRDKLKVIMAGRAAEEVMIGSVSTGAEGDIVQATDITTSMICKWGFSEAVGQIAISARSTFLGDSGQSMNCSEETRRLIDMEIKELIDNAYNDARQLIKENKEAIAKLANALLERETLNADEVRELLNMPNPV